MLFLQRSNDVLNELFSSVYSERRVKPTGTRRQEQSAVGSRQSPVARWQSSAGGRRQAADDYQNVCFAKSFLPSAVCRLPSAPASCLSSRAAHGNIVL